MVKIFTPFLVLLLNVQILEIKEVKLGSRDYTAKLISKTPNTDITLDCSSFIHNLDIKIENASYWFYLDENECEYIFKYFYENDKNERRCLIFEKDYLNIDLCENTKNN